MLIPIVEIESIICPNSQNAKIYFGHVELIDPIASVR